jgi:hypothetical protein
MNGHEQTTHLLLQHFKGLLNMKGEEGYSPLHVSTIKDYFKCIEMLLGLGADVNAIDAEGNNCLHIAMKYNSLKSLKILARSNIDVNCKNKAGLKPVDVASSFQTEAYYNSILKDAASDLPIDILLSPDASSTTFDDTTTSSLSVPKQRLHSTSLPPLPSVTARRPSNPSSITRSPVPRSAISLEFNGSNSSSYIYSPIQSMNSQQKQPFTGLNIKPPTLGMTKSSSPILYSPTNLTIREEFQLLQTPTLGGLSIRESIKAASTNSTGDSLSSFPSMTSLSSGNGRRTPTESRTRANSSLTGTPQSVNFVSIGKTRSNSGGDARKVHSNTEVQDSPFQLPSLPQRKAPGKISSSSNASNLTLSRTSTNTSTATVSTSSENEYTYDKNSQSNRSLNSSKMTISTPDHENESFRSKLSNKFDLGSNSHKKRTPSSSSSTSATSSTNSSRRGSILNINISSLRRRKEE